MAKRIFVVDGKEIPDPNPSLTTNEVRAHFSTFYPEVATAEARETKRGDDTVITFEKRVGTKG